MEDHIIIRPLTSDDLAAHVRLKSQAFDRGRVVTDEALETRDVSKTTETSGVFDHGDLKAVLTVRSFDIHWPGSITGTLPMGGIAGVATGIEARGRGYVDRLLRDSLVQMRDAGQVVSALNPFAWAFYRRFGWDWVGEKRTFTLPLRELRSASEGKLVRRIAAEEAAHTLSGVYERYSTHYRGALTSDSHQWAGLLKHDGDCTTYVYAYFPEGSSEPEGYLLWRYEEQTSDGGKVRDFVATSPEAFRALLSVLHYLATQCETGVVTLPADSPLWLHLMHWDLETKTQPMFMGRVVDVCAAMRCLSAPSELPDRANVAIRIQDPIAAWNDGTFLVSVCDGKVECEPVSNDRSADITCDIQAFSQAFWGTPSLSTLVAAGRVTITDAARVDLLSRLLPAAPVFTLDFF